MPLLSRLCCLAVLTGLFAQAASAQVRQNARPLSERDSLPREIPTRAMPRPDVEALAREDRTRGFGPFRYGAVIDTDLGLSNAGRWDGVPAEDAFVWRLRIRSPGAHSLGIVPAVPFQGGLLCIASPLRRSVVTTASGGTPGNCDASFDLDWNAFASGNAGGNPAAFLTTPGQWVDLQVWCRDTVQHGSFLSEALSYQVCP